MAKKKKPTSDVGCYFFQEDGGDWMGPFDREEDAEDDIRRLFTKDADFPKEEATYYIYRAVKRVKMERVTQDVFEVLEQG